MPAVIYRITLQSPCIFTALEGEPNSAVSYDFIPGSVIRGLLIGTYTHAQRQENRHYNFDVNSDEEQNLFFSHHIRYLNAYPVVYGQRSLPVPASWKCLKYEKPDVIYDDAVKQDQDKENESVQKTKSLSGFAIVTAGRADVYKPSRVLNIHTQRARRDPKEQLVYRYDALATEQTFEGVILCEHQDIAADLKDLLLWRQEITIGGARSAGYGLGRVDGAYITDNWTETPQKLGETIILTLTSDVILRDENGEYAPTLEALQKTLTGYGMTCTETSYVALQTTLVGGFNRKWGLPLPQTLALKRGSVVKLDGVDVSNKDAEDLIWYGIGERTNEGFGRMVLNWQPDSELILSPFTSQEVDLPADPVLLSEASQNLWERIEQHMQDARVEKQLAADVFLNKAYIIRGKITRTQIARLRTIIANELRKPNPTRDTLILFLKDIEGKAAGKQFNDSRLDGKPLTEWLNEMLRDARNKDTDLLHYVDIVLERTLKEKSREAKKKRKVEQHD